MTLLNLHNGRRLTLWAIAGGSSFNSILRGLFNALMQKCNVAREAGLRVEQGF